MSVESQSNGEWPINWKVWTFPKDARLVLKLRADTSAHLYNNPEVGAYTYLAAEGELFRSSETFRARHNKVNQPITFSLPNFVLRALSWL